MRDAKTEPSKKLRIYIASPLFSAAEKTFNLVLAEALADAFDVYLPQRDGLLLEDLVRDGVAPADGGRLVFEEDIRALHACDVLLIVLDGRAVDEGAAFELGLAHGAGKECFGLQTDPRRVLPWGNNPMIAHALRQTFTTVEEVHGWASVLASSSRSVRHS